MRATSQSVHSGACNGQLRARHSKHSDSFAQVGHCIALPVLQAGEEA